MRASTRSMAIAFGLSLAAHLAFMAIPLRPPTRPRLPSIAQAPMTVTIVPAEPSPTPEPETTREPVREIEPVVAPRRAEVPKPLPAPAPVVPRPVEMPVPPRSLPEVVRAPQVDMLAAINARRERRRAAEEAAA